ncbi:MAG: hypothetical protein U0136_22045 [Bdellovibrionota bacterium]
MASGRREGNEEFLYITTNTGKDKPGRIIKTRLNGEKIWEISTPEGHQGAWNPTECTAIGGDQLIITNGYGSGYMYLVDSSGKVLKTLFKPGKGPGELNGAHGVMFDSETNLLWVHDRGNRRIQWTTPDGEFKGELNDSAGFGTPLRMPCGSTSYGRFVLMPDLEGRLTLFAHGAGELPGTYGVVGLWGDCGVRQANFKAYRGNAQDKTVHAGVYGTPHYAKFAPNGDIIVAEWHPTGRVTRLKLVS